jgi:hypothetical protein
MLQQNLIFVGIFRNYFRIKKIETIYLPQFNYDDYFSYPSSCIRVFGVKI